MKPLSEVQKGDVVLVDYKIGYTPKLCDVSYVVPGDFFQADGHHKWHFDGTSVYAGYRTPESVWPLPKRSNPVAKNTRNSWLSSGLLTGARLISKA